MSGRRVIAGTVAVGMLGLVASFLGGRPRQVSVELWVAVVAAWFAWRLLNRLTDQAPIRADRLTGAWRWSRGGNDPPDTRPRGLVMNEGLVVSARDSERAHALRLRPKLIELADHLLQTRHGIDPTVRPERAAAALGDLYWLVDPDGDRQRSPEVKEIDELLDILLADGERNR